MEICDEYLDKNFDQQIFTNLGQNFKESIAEALAALISPPGFSDYIEWKHKEVSS